MALDNAPAGGDYITREEWLELANEGALVVFRVKQICPPERLGSDTSMAPANPVVADILIVNGVRAGDVYRDEKLIGNGITNMLRKCPVGDDRAARMVARKRGATDYAAANPCGPDEFEKIKALFASTGGDPYSAAEIEAKGKAPADDEPPF